VGATICFCSFLVIASNNIMALLFMAVFRFTNKNIIHILSQVGATIYFCSFLVIASNIIMALFMAVSAEYVSYDLLVGDTALVTVGHLRQFQVRLNP